MNRAGVYFFYFCIVFIFIAHLAGAFAPSSVNWGVHHLGFLPLPVAGVILAAMASLLFPPVLDSCASVAERISRTRFLSAGPGPLGWAILAAGIIALEVLCRERTFFLGDGYLVTRDLAGVTRLAAIPTVFYSSPLAAWIAWRLREVWQWWGWNDPARLAWESLSVLSGPVFVVVAWKLSVLCFSAGLQRILFFLTILVAGWAQLFFGYVETYPPLAVAILTYLWLALRFTRHQGGLAWPAVVFALLLVTHVSSLLLFPSLAVLFLIALREGRLREALISSACGAAALVLLLLVCGTTPIGLWNILLMGRGSLLPVVPRDNYFVAFGLFSGWHLLNLLNAVLLLFPLFPAIALFVLLEKSSSRFRIGPSGLFAVTFALCAGLWCVLFNFVLGMSRDWDVPAPFFMGIAVLLTIAWYRAAPGSGETARVMVATLLMTGLHSAGWIAVNAGTESSLRRAEMLPDGRQWARWSLAYTYEDLGSFFRKKGDFKKAEYYTRAMATCDSTNGRRWTALGYLLDMEGKTGEAIDAYRTGIGHGATDKGSFHALALALYRSRRTDEAIDVYRDRLRIDPADTIAALNLGLFYQQARGDHARAVDCFLRALEIDPTLADAYRALGDSYRALGKDQEAAASYEKYRSLSAPSAGGKE